MAIRTINSLGYNKLFSILLYFPEAGDVFWALSLFIIANIAFEMGTVFCNSYLPDLSNQENSGSISGFAEIDIKSGAMTAMEMNTSVKVSNAVIKGSTKVTMTKN